MALPASETMPSLDLASLPNMAVNGPDVPSLVACQAVSPMILPILPKCSAIAGVNCVIRTMDLVSPGNKPSWADRRTFIHASLSPRRVRTNF